MTQRFLMIFAPIFLSLLVVTPAMGHHFKGLPHYGYFDNYSQVPTLDFLKHAGRYEFLVTVYNFQGLSLKDAEAPDDVRLFIYIFDIKKGKAFSGNASFRLVKGGKTIFDIPNMPPEKKNIFSINQKIVDKGKFKMNISFRDDSGEEIVNDIYIRLEESVLAKFNIHFIALGFFLFVVALRALLASRLKVSSRKLK